MELTRRALIVTSLATGYARLAECPRRASNDLGGAGLRYLERTSWGAVQMDSGALLSDYQNDRSLK
jgi:hypothetical protein